MPSTKFVPDLLECQAERVEQREQQIEVTGVGLQLRRLLRIALVDTRRRARNLLTSVRKLKVPDVITLERVTIAW